MNVAGSANSKCIVDYLSVNELRLIFMEALPILKKNKYKLRASNKGPEFKILMDKTYKQKIR